MMVAWRTLIIIFHRPRSAGNTWNPGTQQGFITPDTGFQEVWASGGSAAIIRLMCDLAAWSGDGMWQRQKHQGRGSPRTSSSPSPTKQKKQISFLFPVNSDRLLTGMPGGLERWRWVAHNSEQQQRRRRRLWTVQLMDADGLPPRRLSSRRHQSPFMACRRPWARLAAWLLWWAHVRAWTHSDTNTDSSTQQSEFRYWVSLRTARHLLGHWQFEGGMIEPAEASVCLPVYLSVCLSVCLPSCYSTAWKELIWDTAPSKLPISLRPNIFPLQFPLNIWQCVWAVSTNGRQLTKFSSVIAGRRQAVIAAWVWTLL